MQKNCDKPEKIVGVGCLFGRKGLGQTEDKVDERKTSMERRGDKMVSDM